MRERLGLGVDGGCRRPAGCCRAAQELIGATDIRRTGRRAAYAFEELNLVALFTQIFLPNEPSRRAAIKAGYREYGRRPYARYQEGEYLEEWLGVLTRDEWKAAARPAG